MVRMARLSGLGAVLFLLPLMMAACGSSSGSVGSPSNAHFTNPVYGRAATMSGPVTVGHVVEPVSAYPPKMPAGYVEQEFFAAGNASAFQAASTPSDGKWTLTPTTSAAYKTRIIVRRPTNAAAFNGTVVVEWMNVSSGESAPDWDYLNPELTRDGYAYVGVSAQALGVVGGKALLGTKPSGGLVTAEPARYGSLHHPGDQYSFDMYAQIGRALRLNQNPAVLGGLDPKRIVAVGESQSAFFLTTFANAVQPQTHTFDGLFIHSRGGTGAPLSGTLASASPPGAGQRIRTDLGVPVFMSETETDLTTLGYASAQQPNTSRIRTWEIAGTAHADTYIVGSFANSLGCSVPINSGPQHVVVQAAFAAFAKWVTSGTPPPSPGPIAASPIGSAHLSRDANGNVIGGVRTPAVDVPISTLSGIAAPGASAECSLFGSTLAFDPSLLTRMYGTHAAYMARFQASLDKAIKAGYILPADRVALIQQAEALTFR